MSGSASISGLSSGLDTAGIINQLMQLEAVPQGRMRTRVSSEQRAVNAMQTLNGRLASLATTAADLADTPGLGSTGQIYHHLRQLVGAGWLRATTRGRHEVPPERLVPLLVILGASTP